MYISHLFRANVTLLFIETMITKIDRHNRTIKSYGIRKFTPRECFRLMGVRDEVINRMQMTFSEAKENNIPIISRAEALGQCGDVAQ